MTEGGQAPIPEEIWIVATFHGDKYWTYQIHGTREEAHDHMVKQARAYKQVEMMRYKEVGLQP